MNTNQLILMTFIYGVWGMFSWEGLKEFLIYSPAVIAGSALGFLAFAKASNHFYRQKVSLMLLSAAATLWWRG